MITRQDLNALRTVLKLVDQHKIEHLQIGQITIVKTNHLAGSTRTRRSKTTGLDTVPRGTQELPGIPGFDPLPQSVEEMDSEIERMLTQGIA